MLNVARHPDGMASGTSGSDADLTGRAVGAGRYLLAELIARGATATVYRALSQPHQREVALKLLLPRFAADSSYREWFLAQGSLLTSLDHPHLVKVHECAEEDGLVFLVMQLAHGGTVRQLLAANGGPLQPLETARIVVGVGEALSYLHEHGLLHLDVKPGNILLGAADWPLLADFGIVRGEGLISSALLGGTSAFMPPEQAGQGAVDGRADEYALAATARELLYGRALPADLQAVITHALAPDPQQRFASPTAFAEAFAAGAERAESVVQPGPRWPRLLVNLRTGGRLGDALANELTRQAGTGLRVQLAADQTLAWRERLAQLIRVLGGCWIALAACSLLQVPMYLLLGGEPRRLAAIGLACLGLTALLAQIAVWLLPVAPYVWPAVGLVLDRRLYGARLPATEVSLSHRAALAGALAIRCANALWLAAVLALLAPALSLLGLPFAGWLAVAVFLVTATVSLVRLKAALG